MANGITKVEAENASLRNRLANSRRTANQRAQQFQSIAVKAVGAYALDGFGLRDTLSIGDFDGLTVLAGVGLLAGEFLDGDAARVAGDLGEMALIVKAYEMGRENAEEPEETTSTSTDR